MGQHTGLLEVGSPQPIGGGGIEEITSSTLTITSPFGPVTDIEDPDSGTGITTLNNTDGTVTFVNPSGPTATINTNVVDSINNGYGITGASGKAPVPAVQLSVLGGILTTSQAITVANTITPLTALTTTFPLGTWDIAFMVTWSQTGTVEHNMEGIIGFGTAAGNFTGPSSGPLGWVSTAAPNVGGMIRVIVQITTSGTVTFNVANSGATSTVLPTNVTGNNTTGFNAVRIGLT